MSIQASCGTPRIPIINAGATNSTFLNCLYIDALNRNPDQGGFNFWSGLLNAGYTRSWVVEQFIAGPEFQNTRASRLGYHTAVVTVTGVNPPNGSGPSSVAQQFTVHYSNPYGYSDILAGQILFNADPNGLNGNGSCEIAWNNGNSIVLIGPNGNLYGSFGGPGPLSNPYCSIDTANSTLVATGAGYDVSLRVTFTPQFDATFSNSNHQIWAYGENTEYLYPGWANVGSWTSTVAAPPSVTSVNLAPNGLLSWTVSDPAGYGNIAFSDVIIGPAFSFAQSCAVRYTTGANVLQLFDDSGSALLGTSVTPGSNATVGNSQCAISGTGASVQGSGNSLTISNVQITLFALGGAQNVYVRAQNFQAQQSPNFQVPRTAFQTGSPSCTATSPQSIIPVTSSQFTPLSYTVTGVRNVNTVVFSVFSQANPGNARTYEGQNQGNGVWTTSFSPTTLTDLGLYTILPLLYQGNVTQSCLPAFLTRVGSPPQADPLSKCQNMTGTWTDGTSAVWTLSQDSSGNVIGSVNPPCTQPPTWPVTGSFNAEAVPQFSITATNSLDPGQSICVRSRTSSGSIAVGGCNTSSGTFTEIEKDGSTLSGSSTLRKACDIPSGETTSAVGWADFQGLTTQGLFRQTLTSSSGAQFGGRAVQEQDPGGGTDGCTFPASAIPNLTAITGGSWLVQPDSSWGNDYIGLVPSQAAYYQYYRPHNELPLSCSISVPQRMVIGCGAGTNPTSYRTNTLTIIIDANSVTVSRDGVSISR